MSPSPRLITALLVVALAAAPARAQVIDMEIKESAKSNKSGGDSVSEEDVLLKKKITACKLDGNCVDDKQAGKSVDKKKEPDTPAPESSAAEETPAAPGKQAGPGVDSASVRTPAAARAPTADTIESDRLKAGDRAARAMKKAKYSADALRSTLRSDESHAPDGAARTGGEPRTVAEMALAARGGYSAAFRDGGLKVAAGPRGEPVIIRADGAPASAVELGRLRERLGSEPAALARRTDFFEVLPRDRFESLKRDFTSRPELRATALRDIGMTERQRDFQWSSSCSGLSGLCNSYASEGSYKKNQFVAPEDLDRVWKASQEESTAEEGGLGEYSAEDRERAAAEDRAEEKYGSGRLRGPNLSSLLAKFGGLGEKLSDTLGLSLRADFTGAGAAPSGAGRGSFAAGTSAGTSARPSPAGLEPPAPQRERGRGRRTWIYALAALAACALIVHGVRRQS